MRIIQVVHGFPPDAWAGTELVTLYLSQALQARGHEVVVVTRTEDPKAEEFSLHEERVAGLRVVRVVNNHTRTNTFRLFYENSFFDELLRRLLGQFQPHVVHFQHLAHFSVSLMALTSRLGYPTVLSLHDFYFPCYRVHLIDAKQRLCPGPERGARCVACLQEIASSEDAYHRFFTMEQALQVPNVILTPSLFLAQRMQEYFPSLRNRSQVIPLGVKPLSVKTREKQPGMPLRVLYVGLLFPPKGAHVLIEALKGLPAGAIEVSLYGAVLPFWRSYAHRLREETLGLPVHFCDPYPHDRLGAVLSQHDVLVMPTICEETFSLVTREALMAGLPVIAARRGALTDAIQDGVNGLFFEAENAADLRRCLARLLTEPGLVERLRPVTPYVRTCNDYAKDIEAIYTRLCPPSRPEPLEDARGEGALYAGPSHTAVFSLSPVTVSVLLPTKNGEKYLAEVLDSVRKQRGHFRFLEIIAVDSGSRDNTLQILRQHGVTVCHIPPHEFGHGKTRNLLASRAQGDFLVFLTQDATPADDCWLENLLAPLLMDPLVAGAYSRHRPRPGCHPMEWHRIVAYELHGRPESRVHTAVDNPDYERNPILYRFFANTSSVIRRSIWEQIPFPEAEFAEDQAWADLVLKAGYKTAYVASSVVFHSHSYGPWINFCRHFEHFKAMRELFAQPRQLTLMNGICGALQMARADLAFWYHQNGQSKRQVLRRWALPAVGWHLAANLGAWLGERADRLPQRLSRLLAFQERGKRR